jgi:2,4-dienoyl-CoA reductase-like NADH-dependent reductase (Old Yellow Enzyme family)/thioredoxin reductase
MAQLTKLFEPIRIGRLELSNRIVMPAMSTNYGNADGTVSDRTRHYYAERARGGAGLIITETVCVAPGGKSTSREPCIYSDDFMPGLRSLVNAVHAYGSKIAFQLHHAGRQTNTAIAGTQPVAPSAIPCPLMREMPRELTTAEVEQLVEAFAQGARRAKEAGADAIELHGAHGYLISAFLSPLSNQRTDRYGGSLQGRLRFALEIVERIKTLVGIDFPLLFRISVEEYLPGGLTLAETGEMARRLVEAGVHCLNVSAGSYGSFYQVMQPASTPRGCLVPLAEEIKKRVDVPVIAVGRINDPLLAEQILAEGKADLVALGRALIADPWLPKKAREGRFEDIRMCTACFHCGDTLAHEPWPMACAVNAAAGNEAESAITPAAQPKRVLVVGGGPAGMEAARVAALRGHRVVLYEEEDRLGGQLLLATRPPHKGELHNILIFLSAQMTRLGVEVRLRQKLTPELVSKLKPEAVVVATGSKPLRPDIPGSDGDNVAMAREVVAGRKAVGEKVVIVGGGQIGCETAELLAQQGKQVTIVEMLPQVGSTMGMHSRRILLRRLRQLGIAMETKTRVLAITSTGCEVSRDDERRVLEADSVVLAVGAQPNREVVRELEDRGFHPYLIGDCAGGGRIVDAIADGFRVGREI